MEEKKVAGAAEEAGAQAEQGAEPKKTTYTQEEVERLLQQEGDRRVTAALKKAEAKHTEAVREAQKLATMNEDEKARYEVERRQKELDEREPLIALLENTAEATKILSEKGLPPALVELVVAADADDMMARINLLDKWVKEGIKAGVERQLASASPRAASVSEGMTRAEFVKLPVSRQQELYRQNPELYQKMTQ